MNKVTTIHLQGVAFQLEEVAYDTLRTYLDDTAEHLENNPDKAEILADIEQAIADKLATRSTRGRNVLLTTDVDAVIAEIGPVDFGSHNTPPNESDARFSSHAGPSSTHSIPTRMPRRLYRIRKGAMISGVCNGLAAYLGIDVTLLRLIVAILIFVSAGTVLIAYLVAIIIIPKAVTPEQIAEAYGPSFTAHDFVRMAREGYYEGLRNIPDRQARQEWKRKFNREMRDWKDKFRGR